MPPFEIITADVLKWAAAYDGEPFHALLCDPPYHLTAIVKRFAKTSRNEKTVGTGPYGRHAAGFMGQTWDGGDIAFRPETWAGFLPLLHPGAFGMAFAGSRGWHRLAVAIEDAGFIIHPSIFLWLYGSGFPKATRIDTQIDRAGANGVEGLSGWLKTKREAAGLTREQLADKVGCTAASIRDWEEGRSRSKGEAPEWILPSPQYRTALFAAIGYPDETERQAIERKGGGLAAAWVREGLAGYKSEFDVTAPATDLAKTWEHHRYGLQALKPAAEPIIVFQKPYEGRPIDNITATGAGALNVDGGRLDGVPPSPPPPDFSSATARRREGEASAERRYNQAGATDFAATPGPRGGDAKGRWPANFALAHAPECVRVGEAKVVSSDRPGHGGETSPSTLPGASHRHSEILHGDADGMETVERWACVPECPVRRLNDQTGRLTSAPGLPIKRTAALGYAGNWPGGAQASVYGDTGYASRFFFTAVEAALTEADVVRYEEKASREERERGLRHVVLCLNAVKPTVRHLSDPLHSETHIATYRGKEVEVACRRNLHPTIKPIDLIRWLATLLLPPGEYAPRRLLVPFAGVGSEVIAAKQAEWEQVVGIELHEKYATLARERLRAWIGML